MKALFWTVCLFLCFGAGGLVSAQDTQPGSQSYEQIGIATISSYFEALKKGDVDTIKNLLSKEVYQSYKALIETNTEYPAFLRDYYQGLEYDVETVEEEANDIRVSVTMRLPDKGTVTSTFIMRKTMTGAASDASGGQWQIVENVIG